jgi:hypothetical protein
LETLDKEIVMAITSGALTMLAESGSGTLAGGAHSDTFMRVARALARRVTECFQRQFDAFILSRAFPGQPALAYFEILANEEVDTGEIIEDVKGLAEAGYDVDAAQLQEKTAYKVTRRQLAPGQSGQPGQSGPAFTNRAQNGLKPERRTEPTDIDDGMLGASLEALLEGMAADFKPVAERLQNLLMDAESEQELQEGLKSLLADLPALAAEVGGNDATVTAWQKILGMAAANELEAEESEAAR